LSQESQECDCVTSSIDPEDRAFSFEQTEAIASSTPLCDTCLNDAFEAISGHIDSLLSEEEDANIEEKNSERDAILLERLIDSWFSN
jgi:hypothetical protein